MHPNAKKSSFPKNLKIQNYRAACGKGKKFIISKKAKQTLFESLLKARFHEKKRIPAMLDFLASLWKKAN
jgi:hypothetical protein